MDTAYDHIQEEALSPDETAENGAKAQQNTLNKDFQEAYKAISSSPWGARLGGFFGSVVKQGENVYKEAQKELTAVSQEATQGLTQLQSTILSRTRGISITSPTRTTFDNSTTTKDGEATPSLTQPASTSTDPTLQESESVIERLKAEAAKRLKEIQKAEDAADEALLKFGTNIRNFLRDAVTIAPPTEGKDGSSEVLFESKDAQGKRVIHMTRFDAQLHVIHSSLDSFMKDPDSPEYEAWGKEFDVDKKTSDISGDLEQYEELRTAMEKFVPDKVSYGDFWKRYYFLRHSIETAEARRRDLLKATMGDEDEVGWDEESDVEEGEGKDVVGAKADAGRPASVESSTTIHPAQPKDAPQDLLKPGRKSQDEKSQADSDISYDMVGATSGAPSHAPSSPKEPKKGDESEEEDWE